MSIAPGSPTQFGSWSAIFRQSGPWFALWLVMVAALLWLRPPASLDELRMLAIAWEMWQREVFLIPILNQLAAPEQPPLMPWLIMAGWKLFGVNDWWPRLLPAVFSLASLFLISRIAALLWMDQLKMPVYAPYIVLASWLWGFFLTLVLVDNLLTFFTLLALYGILHAWRYTNRIGWFIYGFATAFAMFASGLTSLFYTLPVALGGPLWAGREHALRWRHWYFDLATGLVFGAGVVAIWGLVVTIEYGTGYALDHLVGVFPENLKMFSANPPVYWYLVMVPLALLPWTVWALVYSRAFQVRSRTPSIGLIFCLVWIVPVLVVLSVLGPRQPQFLLPILPAFGLLITYLLFNEELIDHGEHRFVMSLMLPSLVLGLVLLGITYLPDQGRLPLPLQGLSPVIGIAVTTTALLVYGLPHTGLVTRIIIIATGLVLTIAPHVPLADFLPTALIELPIYVGIGIALIGVVIGWLPSFTLDQRIVRNAMFSMLLVLLVLGYVHQDKTGHHAAVDAAKYLEQAESTNLPVAHVGVYDGRFHFNGRLREAFTELQPEQVEDWVRANPSGKVITYVSGWQPDSRDGGITPDYESAFFGTTLRIWTAASLGAG